MTRTPLFVGTLIVSIGAAGCSSAPTPSTQGSIDLAAATAPAVQDPTPEPALTISKAPGTDATAAKSKTGTPTAPYDLAPWHTVVSNYATRDGGFRYQALRANAEHAALLSSFVQTIGSARPTGWARNEQLAFYINAYNALTIASVLELWPVQSVMREQGFFNQRQHTVAGQRMTLDHLENQIIRPRFSEPRIHFLVNCASTGCPHLVGYAIAGSNLDRALNRQARSFVRRTTQIDRAGNRIRTSQIFEWFAADFGGADGVREFIASRLDAEDAAFVRATSTRIEHFDYDWSLNDR